MRKSVYDGNKFDQTFDKFKHVESTRNGHREAQQKRQECMSKKNIKILGRPAVFEFPKPLYIETRCVNFKIKMLNIIHNH